MRRLSSYGACASWLPKPTPCRFCNILPSPLGRLDWNDREMTPIQTKVDWRDPGRTGSPRGVSSLVEMCNQPIWWKNRREPRRNHHHVASNSSFAHVGHGSWSMLGRSRRRTHSASSSCRTPDPSIPLGREGSIDQSKEVIARSQSKHVGTFSLYKKKRNMQVCVSELSRERRWRKYS